MASSSKMWPSSHSGGEEQRNKDQDRKLNMTTTVRNHIAAVEAEVVRLKALLEIYPDLTFETDRWRRTYQCSRSVNATATEYEIRYSCSCCPDPALYVRIYVETPHGRVYARPHQIEIGERDGVDCPIPDWETLLRDRGIQGAIVERLRAYFEDQMTEDVEDDEAIRCGEGGLESRTASGPELPRSA